MYGIPVSLYPRSLSTGSLSGLSRTIASGFPFLVALLVPTWRALGQWVVPSLAIWNDKVS